MKKDLISLLKRVREYSGSISDKKIQKVYEFAEEALSGFKRLSGDGVIDHVLETAKILSTLKVDEPTLIAALLHEIPQYTEYKVADIEKRFGSEVSQLVAAFEKIGAVKAISHIDDSEMDTLRKMFLAMAKDLRVVLIKLADRLHNLQTLNHLSTAKQKKIARETMEIFVPIASRLGVYTLRSTLEDLCFKYLNEREYKNIQEQLKRLGKKRKHSIDEITSIISKFIDDQGLKGAVSGRFKNTYSIYKKLKQKGKTSIDDIHDIFALRIILVSNFNSDGKEDLSNLYKLIGHIHNKWKPLPGRFKDYVGFPKPNGYKSLHTTIIGIAPYSLKEPVEIQIRTERMHEEAEYGIASHWLYKESKGSSAEIKQKAQIDWIKSLADLDAVNSLKFDLFQDRIFVFTPKGEVKDLPKGATPIDFAYSVHTDLGNKCVMAKIQGSIVPLNYKLNNGEVVEIITKVNSSPKLEWLSIVKTQSARNKIKSFFKDVFEKEEPKEIKKKKNVPKKLPRKIYSAQFVKQPADLYKRVIVGGEKGLPVKFAKCCKPEFDVPISGYITRGSAVSIHRKDCKVYKTSYSKRHINAKWDNIR